MAEEGPGAGKGGVDDAGEVDLGKLLTFGEVEVAAKKGVEQGGLLVEHFEGVTFKNFPGFFGLFLGEIGPCAVSVELDAILFGQGKVEDFLGEGVDLFFLVGSECILAEVAEDAKFLQANICRVESIDSLSEGFLVAEKEGSEELGIGEGLPQSKGSNLFRTLSFLASPNTT